MKPIIEAARFARDCLRQINVNSQNRAEVERLCVMAINRLEALDQYDKAARRYLRAKDRGDP